MKEEKLKEAFSKIKEDILSLGKEISFIREELFDSNQLMKQINEDLISLKLQKITESHVSTHLEKTSTHPATSTHPQEIGGLKSPNLPISIGNEGVSTDRQTNRQTVRQTHPQYKIPILSTTNTQNHLQTRECVVPKEKEETQEKPMQQQISEASEILDSLDTIKKEIRKKFKRITKQEMLVFSTVYTLEEQDPELTYKKIALKLGLSQSSIRDYIQRMINKGIPIVKEKLNNKKIILHISPELKKIATLDTITKLRKI